MSAPAEPHREAALAGSDADATFSRRALVGAGLGAGVLAAVPLARTLTAHAANSMRPRCWSARAGWADGLPSAGDHAHISDHVVLDQDVSVAGLTIARGASLQFSQSRSVTMTSTGNVVIRGTLLMAPESGQVRHLLRFRGIDESQFVGGMDISPHDVGVFVRDKGRLLLQGSSKTAWVRAASDLVRGSTQLSLATPPEGWRPGDELVITPTGSPRSEDHFDEYDTVRIVGVTGRVVTVQPALAFDHLAHDVGRGTIVATEVMNMTRNVRIEGSPRGRTHIHVMTSVPQDMRNFALRHVGPRLHARDPKKSAAVLGRYGLHFHMCGTATRGTIVQGAVVRDCGSHSFVPHGSHGITFRSCISHNGLAEPFWWDLREAGGTPQAPSNNLLLDSCIASRVLSVPQFRGFRLSGFLLGRGSGNRARNCVAVGVQGTRQAGGFEWPGGVGDAEWRVSDCISHNNKINGIFVWQNTSNPHVVRRFIGYHNGVNGIEHGAYLNGYVYRNSVLYGNGHAAIRLHALSSRRRQLRFVNVLCDGAGISQVGVEATKHRLPGFLPVLFQSCSFVGHELSAFGFSETEGRPGHLAAIHCTAAGRLVHAVSGWLPGSTLRWSDAESSFVVSPWGTGATDVSDWNAARSDMAGSPGDTSPTIARTPLDVPAAATSSPRRSLHLGFQRRPC